MISKCLLAASAPLYFTWRSSHPIYPLTLRHPSQTELMSVGQGGKGGDNHVAKTTMMMIMMTSMIMMTMMTMTMTMMMKGVGAWQPGHPWSVCRGTKEQPTLRPTPD